MLGFRGAGLAAGLIGEMEGNIVEMSQNERARTSRLPKSRRRRHLAWSTSYRTQDTSCGKHAYFLVQERVWVDDGRVVHVELRSGDGKGKFKRTKREGFLARVRERTERPPRRARIMARVAPEL